MMLTQSFEFSAAHKLEGNVGEPLHGHNYKMEITLKGKVNQKGFVQDTREFKEIVNNIIIKKLDNSFLNDFFQQPTMENVVKHIWEELKDLPLHEIRLWENPNTSITYDGSD